MQGTTRFSVIIGDSTKEYLADCSDGERLAFLEAIIGHEVNGPINRRAAVAARIDAYRLPNGNIWVQHSSLDCDGVRGYHSYQIKGTLQAFNEEYRKVEEWADGPFSLVIVPEEGLNESIGNGWGIY